MSSTKVYLSSWPHEISLNFFLKTWKISTAGPRFIASSLRIHQVFVYGKMTVEVPNLTFESGPTDENHPNLMAWPILPTSLRLRGPTLKWSSKYFTKGFFLGPSLKLRNGPWFFQRKPKPFKKKNGLQQVGVYPRIGAWGTVVFGGFSPLW